MRALTTAGENVTIRLVDPSMSPYTAGDWLQGRWLGLTFLNPEERYLPNVQKGDIVLVRCAQVSLTSEGQLHVLAERTA